MKRCKLLLLPLVIFVFQGCSSNVSKESEFDPNATGYQTDFKRIVQNNVEVEAYLKEDLQLGELILHMTIRNNSDDVISVDYLNCALSVNTERVVVPEARKSFRTEIPDGEEEIYEIHYYPINSLDFYYKTDYRGDMKKRYSLKLDFIRDKGLNQLLNKAFTFQLSEDSYQHYLANYAREKHMQIFRFDAGSAFTEKQKKYLKKILPDKSDADLNSAPDNEGDFIFAEDPGITVNKRLVKINAYQFKDTLVVDMRMLNQDAQRLKVLLSECKIETINNKYSPVKQFSDSFENGQFPDSTYIFKPGTRLHLLLKYHIPENQKQWKLNTDWLLVDITHSKTAGEIWKKLLYTDLMFKPMAIAIEAD